MKGVVSDQARRKGDDCDEGFEEVLKKRAEARFKKDVRAQEGAKALLDYHAEGPAVYEKTARLRALRLAKEAAEMCNSPNMPTWLGEALTGAALGALVFLGLTLLLVGGSAVLVHWL